MCQLPNLGDGGKETAAVLIFRKKMQLEQELLWSYQTAQRCTQVHVSDSLAKPVECLLFSINFILAIEKERVPCSGGSGFILMEIT